MADIFDNKVLCKNCNREMKKATLVRNGFEMRALICENCNNKIVHPQDEAEYNNFLNLKNKVFKVKLRLVGNSYAISIPKEIVGFIKEQEKIFDDVVKLTFNDAKKLMLMFD
jgi:protein-arginine kinase activator protein McsA